VRAAYFIYAVLHSNRGTPVRTPPKKSKRIHPTLLGRSAAPLLRQPRTKCAKLDPPHERLGAQHHRIKIPFHAKNLPFAFDELYEIRAFRSYRPRPGPNTLQQ
jgi:hypothetical protein